MSLRPAVLLFLAVAPVACRPTPATKPGTPAPSGRSPAVTVAPPSAAGTTAATGTAARFDPPPADPVPSDPPTPEELAKLAEPLPPAPQADPKSVLKPLAPDKSLMLETKPDGSRRVLVTADVCLRQGPLEVFLCKTDTKEHEAILRTPVNPELLHAALLAAGAEKGTPVQFVDPKTGEAAYKPATGEPVRVLVHYRKDGKLHTHPAQDWVTDIRTKKPMAHGWVFAGSRFVSDPDRPNAPPYYTANNGEVIGISNFPDSMLDLPVEVSKDNADLLFEAATDKIPPLLSKVWVVLEPAGKKKAK